MVWSVVTPQAVAYAQIAGLPPEYGLIAAPGALLGYALLGSSRTLIVSATTATSALSAAAVAPLADGDAARFAALSAALALVAAAALVLGGALRLGSLTDFVSKPVITGFLFGLGLLIAVGQLPKLLGVPEQDGGVFAQLEANPRRPRRGARVDAGRRRRQRRGPRRAQARAPRGCPPRSPCWSPRSWCRPLLGLDDRGVSVVGDLPSALPDPAVPDVSWDDLIALLPAGLAVMILSTEGVSVARALAAKDGYAVDVNREMIAVGGANALSGITSGFVQCGGASQTAAAEEAGARTQLTAVVAAVLIAADRRVPRAPVRRPPAGDPRRDRRGGGVGLLARRRAAPLRLAAPQRHRPCDDGARRACWSSACSPACSSRSRCRWG